jgi:fructose-1,6-bisphosphatase/sedoheptulose 1,7-bisphosphatase-like protein
MAKAKGVPISEVTACILDRPRHAELIKAVRGAGAGVQLIPDGDIAGVIWTTDPKETGIDIYLGSGGARRACWQRQRCGVSAGRCRAGWRPSCTRKGEGRA